MQCLLCGESPLVEFLHLGNQPLANKYPTTQEFATENFSPMQVLFCEHCKNVQLGTIISRERMFVDYYYLSSVNLGLVRHFEDFAKQLSGARLVVDVGSNDGILLKPLKEMNVRSVGIDPSINVSKMANDLGLPTITSFFNAAAVEEVKKDWGMPDIVVASSIFTHLENPHEFVKDVKNLLAADGRFIIEVEYIGNILRDTQFERFYFDRVFYYSLTSLRDLCEAHGMHITDVEEILPHGGSLRVTVRHKNPIHPIAEAVIRLLEEEQTTLTPETVNAFKQTAEAHVAALRKILEEYKAAGLVVAGYGAPARVATITNYGAIGPQHINFIVDDSPLKQNKFSPGTHIPIVTKAHLDEHGADILLVFAYEYLADIQAKTNGNYRYMIPIPPREVAPRP